MASRRFRAKNSLSGTVGNTNARLSKSEKRKAPDKLKENIVTTPKIKNGAITQEKLDKTLADRINALETQMADVLARLDAGNL